MEKNDSCAEKRKFERVNVSGVEVSYKLLDLRSWSKYLEQSQEAVQNISLGGIALRTSHQLSLKAPVGLDIKINSKNEVIKTFGRVAWIKKVEEKDDYWIGISFSWWKKEEDKNTIKELIQKNAL